MILCALAVAPAALGAPGTPAARSKPAVTAAATGPALTLVYGDNHVFGITPPAGWTVDDTSGLGSKIRVVLYPRGQKWASAPTVMYANPLHQDARARKTVAQMIDHDVKAFRKAQPKGKVSVAPILRTTKGKVAEVRYFAADGTEAHEAVAYIPEDDLVMLLVLSSREPGGFRKALPAFETLVKGYQFVGGDIQTPSAPKR